MADSGVQLFTFLCLASLLVVLIMMFAGIAPSSGEGQSEERADDESDTQSGGG